ncbi:MAG: hydrogenase maturation protease [Dehalococcoidales bacterium]|nr:MAG: hydrogenase maturation protease [Dehalococcoidales bacterium]
MNTLVLGLGNPILSDDSVGFRVIEELQPRFTRHDLTFVQSSVSGLNLLETIVGYKKLIIIDSIQTKNGQAGEIYTLTGNDIIDTSHISNTHGIGLPAVFELGNKLGRIMPQQVTIFAIEAADVTNFSERCTNKVEEAIPAAAAMVADELNSF